MRRAPVLLPLALAACVAGPQVGRDDVAAGGPAEARDGACYARGIVPATLETTTREVIETPAMRLPDGTVLREEVRATVTETVELEPRGARWFEAPCPLMAGDADFVAQVQRALAARGLYDGPAHGRYDQPTRAAVAAFQADTGPESVWLSLESARRLGLVALGRDGA